MPASSFAFTNLAPPDGARAALRNGYESTSLQALATPGSALEASQASPYTAALFGDGASWRAVLPEDPQTLALEDGDVWVSRELLDADVAGLSALAGLREIGKWGEAVAFKLLMEEQEFVDVCWMNGEVEQGQPYDITLRLRDSPKQVYIVSWNTFSTKQVRTLAPQACSRLSADVSPGRCP